MLNDFHILFYFVLLFKVLFISTVNCKKKKWEINFWRPRQNHHAGYNDWIEHLESGHKVIEKKMLEPGCHVHYDRCNNSLKVPLRNSSSLSLLLLFRWKCRDVRLSLFFLIANFFSSKKTQSGNVHYEENAFPIFFVQKQLCCLTFSVFADWISCKRASQHKNIQLDQ